VASGGSRRIQLIDQVVNAGDGACFEEEAAVSLTAQQLSEILLFDLPSENGIYSFRGSVRAPSGSGRTDCGTGEKPDHGLPTAGAFAGHSAGGAPAAGSLPKPECLL